MGRRLEDKREHVNIPLWCEPQASEIARGWGLKKGWGCFQSTLCIWLSLLSITHTHFYYPTYNKPLVGVSNPQPYPHRVNYAACRNILERYRRSWCLRPRGIFPAVLSSIPGELLGSDKLCNAVCELHTKTVLSVCADVLISMWWNGRIEYRCVLVKVLSSYYGVPGSRHGADETTVI